MGVVQHSSTSSNSGGGHSSNKLSSYSWTHNWYDLLSCANYVFESCNSFLPYKVSVGTTRRYRDSRTGRGAAAVTAAAVQCSAIAEATAAEGRKQVVVFFWRLKWRQMQIIVQHFWSVGRFEICLGRWKQGGPDILWPNNRKVGIKHLFLSWFLRALCIERQKTFAERYDALQQH